MGKSTITTEQAILKAAEEMFLEKGFSMVSTTDIANKVGCNQALVHYYYRTKENLFMKVFTNKVDALFDMFSHIVETETLFENRINIFIDQYFGLFIKSPRIPFLIVNELILNPTRRKYIREYINQRAMPDFYYKFDCQVKEEIQKGHICEINTLDLILHIVSLTVFTFVSLPVLEDLLPKTDFSIKDYVSHRKDEIKKLIIQGLRP